MSSRGVSFLCFLDDFALIAFSVVVIIDFEMQSEIRLCKASAATLMTGSLSDEKISIREVKMAGSFFEMRSGSDLV